MYLVRDKLNANIFYLVRNLYDRQAVSSVSVRAHTRLTHAHTHSSRRRAPQQPEGGGSGGPAQMLQPKEGGKKEANKLRRNFFPAE